MTALGTDAPNVVGLVYIAAFGLDEGESIGGLLAQGPPTPALAHLDIDEQGFAWLPEDDFVNHFAGDVDPVKARVMYAVQQPLHASTLERRMGVPAWKSLPSWYLVATSDEAIPPDAERQFAAAHGRDHGRGRPRATSRWSPTPETVRLIEGAPPASFRPRATSQAPSVTARMRDGRTPFRGWPQRPEPPRMGACGAARPPSHVLPCRTPPTDTRPAVCRWPRDLRPVGAAGRQLDALAALRPGAYRLRVLAFVALGYTVILGSLVAVVAIVVGTVAAALTVGVLFTGVMVIGVKLLLRCSAWPGCSRARC